MVGSIKFNLQRALTILSPEKTILTYPLASVGRRILAHLIDVAVIFLILMAAQQVIGLLALIDADIAIGLIMFISVATVFLYFIFLEGLWNGRTVGKAACGLRVRMVDGTPIRFGSALGRNLLRPGDFLPLLYFAGLLSAFTTPWSQRLGDLVAGTVVVRDVTPDSRFSPAPHSAGVHPFEGRVGELRKMTDDDYIALRRLCDRFPELPPYVQEKMLREVWAPVATRIGVGAVSDVHPIYLAEATVMKYGRVKGLL